MLAQEEARRLGHNFVGTEQILLGLIGEGTGIAAKVLKSVGVNLKDARVEVRHEWERKKSRLFWVSFTWNSWLLLYRWRRLSGAVLDLSPWRSHSLQEPSAYWSCLSKRLAS